MGRPHAALALALALALASCKLPFRRGSADAGATTGASPFATTTVAAAPTPAPRATATLPTGYVAATVLDVVPTRAGDAVLLVDDGGKMVLPIFIGGTEAMTIKLRLEGKHYKRPLTHDLLSDVMHDLGGTAIKVQVDDLRSETYIGSAFIEKADGSLVELDARPSDCIALSLGERVPIYVRKRVFDAAGVPKSDFEDDARGSGHKKGDPLSL